MNFKTWPELQKYLPAGTVTRLKLAEYCEVDGKVLKNLAYDLGVSYATVQHWNSGIHFPPLIVCIAIANYFGCTLDDLITHELSPVQDARKKWKEWTEHDPCVVSR